MSTVEKMRFETYLAVIKNSIGTKMFSEGYARVDGQVTNILKGGEVSCAFFVSGVLSLFDVKLIDHTHTTVASTAKALSDCGWEKLDGLSDDQLQPGDIIVWRKHKFPDGEEHSHIGFYIGEGQAVSNDYVSGTPQSHSLHQTPDGLGRMIDCAYRGRHLFESAD